MQQPNFKLTTNNLGTNHAEITIDPLPRNFGHTVGNAIRRVLLSSLTGAAPVRVRIEGVQHQFSTLDGLSEDIIQFVLNVKGLRFVLEAGESATIKLDAKGEQVVTGKDLDLPSGVSLINTDLVLANLTSAKAKLKATIEVEKGTGYVPADRFVTNEVGVIPLDASFSPILKANYTVESTRVGRNTDLDKVILDVITDGTIDPESAVVEASKILSLFFTQVHNPVFAPEEVEAGVATPLSSSEQAIEELDLPVRVINALKKGGYKSVNDIIATTVADLMKVKNIGEKSAEEIINKAREKSAK